MADPGGPHGRLVVRPTVPGDPDGGGLPGSGRPAARRRPAHRRGGRRSPPGRPDRGGRRRAGARPAGGRRMGRAAGGGGGGIGERRRRLAPGGGPRRVGWRVPWGAADAERDRAPPTAAATGSAPARRARALAGDQMGLARRLAAVLSRLGPPDLVVCGDRSALGGTGAAARPAGPSPRRRPGPGAGVAGGQGGGRGDTDAVIAERRLDGGWRERLRLSRPRCARSRRPGVRLRRAPLAGALDAADAPIPVVAGGPGRGRCPAAADGASGGGGVRPLARRRSPPLPAPDQGGAGAGGFDPTSGCWP